MELKEEKDLLEIKQKIPDFFTSEKECKEAYLKEIKTQTNPRYPLFKQTYFTAGDVDQFFSNKNPTNGINPIPDEDFLSNVWKDHSVGENISWTSYTNINSEDVDNTFRYMFEKFKKGVFIKIKNNRLETFLPFSKFNYTNEWGNKIKVDPKYKMSLEDFLLYVSRLQDQKYETMTKDKINRFTNKWYANNCLLRYEFPLSENDRGLSNFKDMLNELCHTHVVPDIELFLNKRDFPLIKRDFTEPYEHIFDTEKQKLLSHRYEKYCPILSMVTTDRNADIPIPTAEDWARVSYDEGKYFISSTNGSCKSFKQNFNHVWETKKDIAVFRGGSTGCGTTIENNPRLRLAYMGSTENGKKYIDAGLTSWNLRPRKTMGNPFLQTIEKRSLPFWKEETDGLVNFMTPDEQSNYKYIINVDGHVSAFRLSLEMSMGSVILLVESKYRMWFHRYLEEGKHYVSVKSDLSDLYEKIEWCRHNDKKCKEIAKNALEFYNTYLTKKGILDFLQKLFFSIKKVTGTYFYNTLSVNKVIASMQLKSIEESQKMFYDPDYNPDRDLDEYKYLSFPFQNRNIYAMDALQSFIRQQNGLEMQHFESLVVHQTKNTIISKLSSSLVKNIIFSQKESILVNETINEAFIGFEINKLLYHIPNFKYTFYYSNKRDKEKREKKSILLSEHIEGVTLQEYIKNGCTLDELCNVFIILCMTLSVAQEKIGFVHYDLYPWNIIMLKVKRQRYTYQFKEYIFNVETDIIPVIVDYGKSHIIKENIHYGTIEPFKTSTIQDCFCLIVSSIFEYTQKNANYHKYENLFKTVLYISNYFSNTEFQKKEIKTQYELSQFIYEHKKYNEMIYKDKCDLEKKDPVHLLFYLLEGYEQKILNFTINVEQVDYPNKNPYLHLFQSPLFYYNLITKRDSFNDILSYLKDIKEKFIETKDKANDVLIFTDVCNHFQLAVNGVSIFIHQYISNTSENKILKDECEGISKLLYETYKDDIVKKNNDLRIGYINTNENFNLAKYSQITFSIPEKILSIMQSYFNSPEKNTNLISLRDMFMFNIFYDLPFKIPNEIAFSKKYIKLVNIQSLVLMNYNANIKTLKVIGKKIYKNMKKELSEITNVPAKTILSIKNILDMC